MRKVYHLCGVDPQTPEQTYAKTRAAELLEKFRVRIAQLFGITIQGNRLTLRMRNGIDREKLFTLTAVILTVEESGAPYDVEDEEELV